MSEKMSTGGRLAAAGITAAMALKVGSDSAQSGQVTCDSTCISLKVKTVSCCILISLCMTFFITCRIRTIQKWTLNTRLCPSILLW